MSGIIFKKNVSHKLMAKRISRPRIMLISGGIEFTRTENRISSLDTLLEQEERYMEILVAKIVGLKPNILLVGRSVCRHAQELFLKSNVVLLQHVKPTLMRKISRQTGAAIMGSTDHIMFDGSVLGEVSRVERLLNRTKLTLIYVVVRAVPPLQTADLSGPREGREEEGQVEGDGRGGLEWKWKWEWE